jgi:hypothetical protein
MVKEERTERLAVRMAPSEAAMLDALAEEAGLSQSDIIRLLVRREYAEKFGDKPLKKKR